jgi:hypothetical protein
MLLNLSNHPSTAWSPEQLDAATKQFGGVIDLPFPNIDPYASSKEVRDVVEDYIGKALLEHEGIQHIHIMGEMTFVHRFVSRVMPDGIKCYASTTERTVLEEADGRKTVQFKFIQFRPYF